MRNHGPKSVEKLKGGEMRDKFEFLSQGKLMPDYCEGKLSPLSRELCDGGVYWKAIGENWWSLFTHDPEEKADDVLETHTYKWFDVLETQEWIGEVRWEGYLSRWNVRLPERDERGGIVGYTHKWFKQQEDARECVEQEGVRALRRKEGVR